MTPSSNVWVNSTSANFTSASGNIQFGSPADIDMVIEAGVLNTKDAEAGKAHEVTFPQHIQPTTCTTIAIYIGDDYTYYPENYKEAANKAMAAYNATVDLSSHSSIDNFRTSPDGSFLLCNPADNASANAVCKIPDAKQGLLLHCLRPQQQYRKFFQCGHMYIQ